MPAYTKFSIMKGTGCSYTIYKTWSDTNAIMGKEGTRKIPSFQHLKKNWFSIDTLRKRRKNWVPPVTEHTTFVYTKKENKTLPLSYFSLVIRFSSSEYMKSFFNHEAKSRYPHLRHHLPLFFTFTGKIPGRGRLPNGLLKSCRILSHHNFNDITWNRMYHFFQCCSHSYINGSNIHQVRLQQSLYSSSPTFTRKVGWHFQPLSKCFLGYSEEVKPIAKGRSWTLPP